MDAETANIPFLGALTGALRCCSSVVWLATLPSERLALHPVCISKNGTLTISAPIKTTFTKAALQKHLHSARQYPHVLANDLAGHALQF
jgi:hypothetical protein